MCAWLLKYKINFCLLITVLLASGCVVSGFGIDEKIYFVGGGNELSTEYKPYPELKLSAFFSCTGKVYSVMPSLVVPLPPIIPVGFMDDPKYHYFDLEIHIPINDEKFLDNFSLVKIDGSKVELNSGKKYLYPDSKDGGMWVNLKIPPLTCKDLDGAEMSIKNFEYEDKLYPQSLAKLEFESKTKVDFGYCCGKH